MKCHGILSTYHDIKDPMTFEAILKRIAEWANREGLENRKCTNFSMHCPNDDDPLNLLNWVTCDIEENDDEN